jgi:methylmalonyl-CoA/ethylmalonyl-CoA epimerase
MDRFRYHHVGIAVQDLKTAIPAYKKFFGYELVSGPFDDPIQKVSVCFLTLKTGDPLIELVAPLGPVSPIDRILKRGGGTYHICYEVSDLGAAIEHMRKLGALLLNDPAPAVAFAMRNIAWLMAAEANLLVELLQA